jgi:hypothetical protein
VGIKPELYVIFNFAEIFRKNSALSTEIFKNTFNSSCQPVLTQALA